MSIFIIQTLLFTAAACLAIFVVARNEKSRSEMVNRQADVIDTKNSDEDRYLAAIYNGLTDDASLSEFKGWIDRANHSVVVDVARPISEETWDEVFAGER